MAIKDLIETPAPSGSIPFLITDGLGAFGGGGGGGGGSLLLLMKSNSYD